MDEGVRLSNPRVLPSAALILGLLGGYMVLFAGLGDLARAQVGRVARVFAAWTGVALIALLFAQGRFDVYSVVAEFHRRGQQLGQGVIEHTMFVAVALVVGLVTRYRFGALGAPRRPGRAGGALRGRDYSDVAESGAVWPVAGTARASR